MTYQFLSVFGILTILKATLFSVLKHNWNLLLCTTDIKLSKLRINADLFMRTILT